MQPKVSIIITTYNRAEYLKEALDSVVAQTYKDWELIVIDDDSHDHTEQIIQQYKSRYTLTYIKNKKNLGFIVSRNIGLDKCKGKYIALLDDDDMRISKDKLEKQVDFLENHKVYGLVGTAVKVLGEKGSYTISPRQEDQDIRNHILRGFQFKTSSVMIRVSTLDEVGNYFDPKYILESEHELYLRIGTVCKVYNDKNLRTARRVSKKGLTYKKTITSRWFLLIVCRKYRKQYPNFFISFLWIAYTLRLPDSRIFKIKKFFSRE